MFVTGHAYRIWCSFIQPAAGEKFCICAHFEKPVLFFINFEPRRFFPPSSQLQVTTIDFPFLSYSSYINTADNVTCHHPLTCRILEEYGEIPQHIKDRIKAAVAESETLPQRFISIICAEL